MFPAGKNSCRVGFASRGMSRAWIGSAGICHAEEGSRDNVQAILKPASTLPACVETREGEEKTIDPVEFFRYARGATVLDPDPDLLPDIRFFHHLLQEYFAALELNQRFEAGEDLSGLWQAARLSTEMPDAIVGK